MKCYFGLIGAGGYGREVMPLLKSSLKTSSRKDAELYFVVEGKPEQKEVNGYTVLSWGDFQALQGDKFFNIAIGDSKARERIATQCIESGFYPFSIFAANSLALDRCKIGQGAIFSPFSMATSNIIIGKFFHGNIYSYVAHDCTIGDYVTFAPGAKCNGNVIIEDHAYIGTGAIIKQGSKDKPIVIGSGAVVGMGAVVTKSVEPNTTVVGNPARLLSR